MFDSRANWILFNAQLVNEFYFPYADYMVDVAIDLYNRNTNYLINGELSVNKGRACKPGQIITNGMRDFSAGRQNKPTELHRGGSELHKVFFIQNSVQLCVSSV